MGSSLAHPNAGNLVPGPRPGGTIPWGGCVNTGHESIYTAEMSELRWKAELPHVIANTLPFRGDGHS